MSVKKRDETAAREEEHGFRFEAKTMDKNFKKLRRWRDGWLVEVRHQHRTTDVPDMIWVSDEFFDMPEAVQFAEIEIIKALTYNPVESGGGYMAAWHWLFKQSDFDVVPNEEAEELQMRVFDKFGAFSLEWYFAKVIGIIEKQTGWEEGTTKFPEPISDPESRFDWGFRAGYLMAEGVWKHDFEIDAMRGVKSVESGKIGAEMTHAITREKTLPRLEKMKALVPKYGVDKAALMLEVEKMGSFEANKKLWSRWMAQQPK